MSEYKTWRGCKDVRLIAWVQWFIRSLPSVSWNDVCVWNEKETLCFSVSVCVTSLKQFCINHVRSQSSFEMLVVSIITWLMLCFGHVILIIWCLCLWDVPQFWSRVLGPAGKTTDNCFFFLLNNVLLNKLWKLVYATGY